MRTIKLFLILFTVLTVSSCNLLDIEPKDFTTPQTFYKNKEEAFMAVTGVYTTLRDVYGDTYSIQIASSDDLAYYDRNPITLGEMPVINNMTSTSNPIVYSVWTSLYSGISNANLFLENIDRTLIEEELKMTYVAEVKFLRAYYHFLLAQMFGNVPYRLETFKDIYKQDMPATDMTEIMIKVATEIELVMPNLLEIENKSYASGRVSQSAAKGLLARIYLKLAGWPSDLGKPMYEKALYWAKEVQSSGKHKLNADYAQIFINMASDKTELKESIFEVEMKGNRLDGHEATGRIGNTMGIANSDMGAESLGYSYGFFSVTLNLWDIYNDLDNDQMAETYFNEGSIGDIPSEKNHPDIRRDWNIAPYKFSSKSEKEYFRYKGEKYTNKDGKELTQDRTAYVTRNAGKYRREYEVVTPRNKNHTPINVPVLRYSDVLLMVAEADNEVNNGPSADAINAMKQVRERALGSYDKVNYEALNYESFKQLVKDERARELCFEFQRKYDLIRWNDYSAEMMKVVQYVSSDTRWDKTKSYAETNAKPVTNSKRHWWLPIPLDELSQNRALDQNPLW